MCFSFAVNLEEAVPFISLIVISTVQLERAVKRINQAALEETSFIFDSFDSFFT